MRRNSKEFLLKISIFLLISLVLSNCSFLKERRSLINDDSKKSSRPIETVPKIQYEQLLAKYEATQRKLWDLKGVDSDTISEKLNASPKKISKSSKNVELAETVDVFGKNGLVDSGKKVLLPAPTLTKSLSGSKLKEFPFSDDQIENQVIDLRKAKRLMDASKYPEALDILKRLGDSSKAQIKVRAKFLIGELLFVQNEHDLAMQMFEEIINKYAFSGIVFKALKRLIDCSEELKLNKKREQYYSILHDFFHLTSNEVEL